MKNLVFVFLLLLLLVVENNFPNLSNINEKSRQPSTTVSEEKKPFSEFAEKTGYRFVYTYKNVKYEVLKENMDSVSAFKSASKDCFSYFTKDRYINEETGLSIIDSCANPRSR